MPDSERGLIVTLTAGDGWREYQPSPNQHRGHSGAGLFAVATQFSDLGTTLLDALGITAGDGHGQGEFQLLELVTTLGIGAVRE